MIKRDEKKSKADIDAALMPGMMDYRPLSNDQEYRLANIIQSCTAEHRRIWARNKLVMHNIRFMLNVATSIYGVKLDTADAMQSVVMGAIEAAGRFEPGRGKFCSYAVHYMKRWLSREVRRSGLAVRLPDGMTKGEFSAIVAVKEYVAMVGDLPVFHEVRHLDFSSAEFERAIVALTTSSSLDKVVGGDSGRMTMGDLLCDESKMQDEVLQISMDAERIIAVANDVLSERSFDVFVMRHGLLGYENGHTLESIGEKYGISRERARQVYTEALWRVQVAFGQARISDPPHCIAASRARDRTAERKRKRGRRKEKV